MTPPASNARFLGFAPPNPYLNANRIDTTLFVGPNGSDTAMGSRTAPFKTIERAASLLGESCQVRVLPGNYVVPRVMVSTGGAAGAPLQIISDVPLAARIIATNPTWAAFILKSDYSDLIGFDISAPNATLTSGVETQASHCNVARCYIHDIPASDASLGGAGISFNDGADLGRIDNNAFENVVVRIGMGIKGTPPAGQTDARWLVHGIYHATSGAAIRNLICGTTGHSIQSWHANARNNVYEWNTCLAAWRSGILISNSIKNGNTGSRARFNISAFHRLWGYDVSNAQGAMLDQNLWWHCGSALANGGTGTVATNWLYQDPGFTNYQMDGSGDYHSRVPLGFYYSV